MKNPALLSIGVALAVALTVSAFARPPAPSASAAASSEGGLVVQAMGAETVVFTASADGATLYIWRAHHPVATDQIGHPPKWIVEKVEAAAGKVTRTSMK